MAIHIDREEFPELRAVLARIVGPQTAASVREYLAAHSDCLECGMPPDSAVHTPVEDCEGCILPSAHHDFNPEFT